MADPRTPRDQETRAQDVRMEYQPPSALPDPEPDADYAYRWVMTHVVGKLEPMHTSKMFREGWTPVKLADHPKLKQEGFVANGEGNVEIGGLILCKMPKQLAKSREEYYARQAQGQMDSVDNTFMRQNDPRMPLFKQRKTRVEFGRGN